MKLPRFHHRMLLSLALFGPLTTGCFADDDSSEGAVESDESDLEAAWLVSKSLYHGRTVAESLQKGERRVHPIYINASKTKPVTVSFSVQGAPAIRAALLTPLMAGKRTTVVSDGYTSRKASVYLTAKVDAPGVYLLSVSAPALAAASSVHVLFTTKAPVTALDPIKSPLSRSELGTESTSILPTRTLALKLAPGLDGSPIALFAQPPRATAGEKTARRNLGTTTVKAGTATFAIPLDVLDGDDLVVRVADYDSEVPLRLWTKAVDGIRVDRLRMPNANDLQFSGASGAWFEGSLDLTLVSLNATTHAVTEIVGASFPNYAFPASGDFTNVRYRIDGTFKTPGGLTSGKVYGIAETPGEGSAVPFTCFTLTTGATFTPAPCP